VTHISHAYPGCAVQVLVALVVPKNGTFTAHDVDPAPWVDLQRIFVFKV
jgi:hypothetical protein